MKAQERRSAVIDEFGDLSAELAPFAKKIGRRDDLRKKYAEEFLKAGLPPLTVAKFLQLEHRLDIIVDLELASQLPSLLTQPVAKAKSTK